MFFTTLFWRLSAIPNRDIDEHRFFYRECHEDFLVRIIGRGGSNTIYVESPESKNEMLGYIVSDELKFTDGEVITIEKSPYLFGFIYPGANYIAITASDRRRVLFIPKFPSKFLKQLNS